MIAHHCRQENTSKDGLKPSLHDQSLHGPNGTRAISHGHSSRFSARVTYVPSSRLTLPIILQVIFHATLFAPPVTTSEETPPSPLHLAGHTRPPKVTAGHREPQLGGSSFAASPSPHPRRQVTSSPLPLAQGAAVFSRLEYAALAPRAFVHPGWTPRESAPKACFSERRPIPAVYAVGSPPGSGHACGNAHHSETAKMGFGSF